MLMSTAKLVVLRLYNFTLGRYRWGAAMLKALLVRRLITSREEPYVASSRFFDPREIGEP